ncbi:terminase small subunit [Streptococcus intermedius]|uniref:terminase small subunit n=1 Tax=Streptococcus intermedius TaxID=1338 RepID=UPI002942A8B3|nr:terminase small subunit [Streptococcus intermedius]WOI91339.1 terminase small subunit [Streptococcus intermedius]
MTPYDLKDAIMRLFVFVKKIGGDGMVLTKLQKKFAEGIALGMKQGQAARYAGYSEKSADTQAYNNMKNVEILELVDELLNTEKSLLKRRFSGLASIAVDKTLDILRDEDAPAQSRLNAAKMILDYAGMEEPKRVNVTADVTTQSNPLEGLTTDELRKLISDG